MPAPADKPGACRLVSSDHSELGPAGRPLAGLLAAVWIAGGIAVIVLGLLRGRWFVLLLGPLCVGYGLLWARVARTGRRLRWPRSG